MSTFCFVLNTIPGTNPPPPPIFTFFHVYFCEATAATKGRNVTATVLRTFKLTFTMVKEEPQRAVVFFIPLE